MIPTAHLGKMHSPSDSLDPLGRECFDHVIVFNEAGLQRLMTLYCSYHERSRTHLSLDKDMPIPRPATPPGDGAVVAIREVGGVHHRYERRAD